MRNDQNDTELENTGLKGRVTGWAKGFVECPKRFPLVVLFLVALTALQLKLFWYDGNYWNPGRFNVTAYYYLSVGGLLSLSLQLWSEEIRKKRMAWAVQILFQLLLCADAGYLYHLTDASSLKEIALAHGSALTALLVSVTTLPFFREKDDMASWNFTTRAVSGAFGSWMVGAVMCGGMCLLTVSLSGLFGLKVNTNVYFTWAVLFCLTLPGLLFLGQLPSGEAKHDRSIYSSPFLEKVARYLFFPMMACYLLVLYAYAAKILVQWELPNGWVSWLVTAIVIGCIALELCLYPSLRRGKSVFERRMARWLPLAIIPLLILMTVGIVRRLNDYGLTLNRLYLLTLNIWYYMVCIGLFVTKVKRVGWIPVSFALIFLLTAVFPFNYTQLTGKYLLKSVKAAIEESYQGTLPMSESEYSAWLDTLPKDEAQLANSRLRMLMEISEEKSESLVALSTDECQALEKQIQENDPTNDFIGCRASCQTPYEIALDKDYATMTVFADLSTDIPRKQWQAERMSVPLKSGKQTVDTLYVRPSDLLGWSGKAQWAPQELTVGKNGSRFVLTGFNVSGSKKDEKLKLTLSGNYFSR